MKLKMDCSILCPECHSPFYREYVNVGMKLTHPRFEIDGSAVECSRVGEIIAVPQAHWKMRVPAKEGGKAVLQTFLYDCPKCHRPLFPAITRCRLRVRLRHVSLGRRPLCEFTKTRPITFYIMFI